MHPLRCAALALSLIVGVAAPLSGWAQSALVTILEGRATLVRQSAKFALVEGVGLLDTDIVETAAATFVQIELADGVRLGLGENTRLMLAPALRGHGEARIYVLQGWLKVTQPGDKPVALEILTPRVVLAPLAGACVSFCDATQFAAFVETGAARVGERAGGAAPLALKGGEFVIARAAERLAGAGRPAPEFLEKMPRPFRDPLPARAGRFKDNPVPPRPQGDVSYDDVAAWLRTEPAIRLPLLDRWRGRLKDKAFRAGVIANLVHHPEWRPVVFPPPPPKPPPPRIEPAASAASAPRATN